MAGHSRPKDGVASLAYVPAIHALFAARKNGVDARNKCGDAECNAAPLATHLAVVIAGLAPPVRQMRTGQAQTNIM